MVAVLVAFMVGVLCSSRGSRSRSPSSCGKAISGPSLRCLFAARSSIHYAVCPPKVKAHECTGIGELKKLQDKGRSLSARKLPRPFRTCSPWPQRSAKLVGQGADACILPLQKTIMPKWRHDHYYPPLPSLDIQNPSQFIYIVSVNLSTSKGAIDPWRTSRSLPKS